MKKLTNLIIFFLSSLIAGTCFSQTNLDSEVEIMEQMDEEREQEDAVFTLVEEMPSYPGGDDALLTYIAQNTVYPDSALHKGLEDKVYVSYIVDVDGRVADVKIAKGKHEVLNEEALRVVSSIKGYKPGIQKGEPVRVQFTMPISFKLQ